MPSALAGVVLLLCLPLVVAAQLLLGAPAFVLPTIVPLLAGGVMTLRYANRSTRHATFEEGEVIVDGAGLLFAGKLLASRAELRQGFVVPAPMDGGGALVHLERRGLRPALFVRVADEAEGQALLQALGFDAASTAAEMWIGAGVDAMSEIAQVALMLLPTLALVGALYGAMQVLPVMHCLFAFMTLQTGVIWGLRLPMHVRIGTDGVMRRWLGRERFVPFAEVTRVEAYTVLVASRHLRGVRLHLRGGRTVRLPTGQGDVGDAEAARRATRIELARNARLAGHVQSAHDSLARGERTTRDWVRALRAMGEGAVGLRTAAVPIEVLLRVVEDTTAGPLARASAAVAALAGNDRDAVMRVRVAAGTTASPKLRVALERTTSGDEEAVAEALEELEALSGAETEAKR
jgi:hypothetical protein